MVSKQARHHTLKKVLLIIAAVLLLLILVLSIAGGRFLFSFALDRDAKISMRTLIDATASAGFAGTEGQKYSEETTRWRQLIVSSKDWFDANGEEVTLARPDGTSRWAKFFPNEGHLYALVCHGYQGFAKQMSEYCQLFHTMGMSVLVPDALAHGRSGGRYIGMGWPERADVSAWIQTITDADPRAQILLYGVSMGGSTVMIAAGEELPDNVKCIISDCGYDSAWEECAYQLKTMFHLPPFPLLNIASLTCQQKAGFSIRDVSCVEQLKKAEVPMLFIHGGKDNFVPFEMLDRVYEACASPVKEKLVVPEAGHGCSASNSPTLYWSTVWDFINRFMDFPQ